MKDPEQCPRQQQRDPYDERLAARLAVMVSVAYLDPENYLLSDAQNALDSETTGGMSDMGYQVTAVDFWMHHMWRSDSRPESFTGSPNIPILRLITIENTGGNFCHLVHQKETQ